MNRGNVRKPTQLCWAVAMLHYTGGKSVKSHETGQLPMDPGFLWTKSTDGYDHIKGLSKASPEEEKSGHSMLAAQRPLAIHSASKFPFEDQTSWTTFLCKIDTA